MQNTWGLLCVRRMFPNHLVLRCCRCSSNQTLCVAACLAFFALKLCQPQVLAEIEAEGVAASEAFFWDKNQSNFQAQTRFIQAVFQVVGYLMLLAMP